MSRFFISHKETDSALASATVELLIESLEISPDEIFCSSVPGHRLRFGATIESQIRDGLQDGDVLIALLTKDSIRSTWVLFELGAAWALGRLAIPILGVGLAYSDLPGSLAQYPCISLNEPETTVRSRLDEALEQLSVDLKVKRKTGGRQADSANKFIQAQMEWRSQVTPESAAKGILPDGYQIYVTEKGHTVFKSTSEPVHYLCPTCYADNGKRSVLQGDINSSIKLQCNLCKSSYRLKNDPPLRQIRRSPTY
jgi:hypothetical protein